MFRFAGEIEKTGKDRLTPMAPDFAMWLKERPQSDRSGRVVAPLPFDPKRSMPNATRVSRVISAIGEAAGVIVDSDPRTGEARKYASAHDLRRSFGFRMAREVNAHELQEMMRHASITTTMKYYVGQDAERTCESARAAYERRQPCTGSSSGLEAWERLGLEKQRVLGHHRAPG